MRNILFAICFGTQFLCVAFSQETQSKKVYPLSYVEELPDGVMAWEQSGLLKDKRETRFEPYDKKAAENLVLDATTERGAAGGEEKTPERETAFRAAYDARGIGIYVEAKESLMRDLLDAAVDPASPAHHEALEIFFAPGLHEVPYYQIFVRMLKNDTTFYDWGMPHKNYRSLKGFAQVEAKPLKTGFGVSLFIPWEAIYDYIPWEGGDWRFSIVRWMPFAKAGGVTWGGQVHETGDFGKLRFQKPTAEQRFKIEKHLARYAWFNFLARSKEATKFWSDEKIGDVAFYEQVLKPVIEKYTQAGEALGSPDDWTADSLKKIQTMQKDWLEFSYKVSALREEYLLQKRFQENKAQ